MGLQKSLKSFTVRKDESSVVDCCRFLSECVCWPFVIYVRFNYILAVVVELAFGAVESTSCFFLALMFIFHLLLAFVFLPLFAIFVCLCSLVI